MSIVPYLRPDLDQSAEQQLPLYITGSLPNGKPGVAYEGRLQIHNQVGACTVVSVTGDPLPIGGTVSIDGDEIVVAWPAYAEEAAPIINPGFEGDQEGKPYGQVKIASYTGPATTDFTWGTGYPPAEGISYPPLPEGIQDDDRVFALIAIERRESGGIGTVPAGWTLVRSQTFDDPYGGSIQYVYSKDSVSPSDSGSTVYWPAVSPARRGDLQYIVARADGNTVVVADSASREANLTNAPAPILVPVDTFTSTKEGQLVVVATNTGPAYYTSSRYWSGPEGSERIGPDGPAGWENAWYWGLGAYSERVSDGYTSGANWRRELIPGMTPDPSGYDSITSSISILLEPGTPIVNPGPGNGMHGWEGGTGWSVTSTNPIAGSRSAVFVDAPGSVILSSLSRYPVNPDDTIHASAAIRQGASSAGNAGAGVRMEFRDADGALVGHKDGNMVMSASNNAVKPSNVVVTPGDRPAGTALVNIACHGLRWISYQSVDPDTERAHMAEALALIDVRLLDHFIVTAGNVVSLAQLGML